MTDIFHFLKQKENTFFSLSTLKKENTSTCSKLIHLKMDNKTSTWHNLMVQLCINRATRSANKNLPKIHHSKLTPHPNLNTPHTQKRKPCLASLMPPHYSMLTSKPNTKSLQTTTLTTTTTKTTFHLLNKMQPIEEI